MIKICATCRKEFQAIGYAQKYCSDECNPTHISKKLPPERVTRWNPIALRRLKGEHVCMWCEQPTEGTEHFCSEDCAVEFYKLLFTEI